VAPQPTVSFQGPEEAFLQRHLAGAQQALRNAVAPSTQAAYSTGWRRWIRFIDQAVNRPGPADYLLEHLAYPARLKTLLAFLHYLHDELSLTPPSVQRCLTGVRHELRANTADVAVFSDPLLRAALHGISKVTEHPTAKRGPGVPFTLDMVLYFSEYAREHPLQGPRLCAMAALLGYFCLMRSSEFCVSGKSDHTLRAGDVEFEVTDAGTMTTRMVPAHRISAYAFAQVRAVRIVSQTAKNRPDESPNPSWFSVLQPITGLFCLARAMYDWASTANYSGGTDYFVSLPSQGGGRVDLKYEGFQRAIKAVGKHFGLDPRLCGTHSLRIGGATALHAAGASDTTIQQAGGWRAPPVATRYPQRTSRGNDLQLQLLQTRDAHQLRDIRMSRMLPPRDRGSRTRPS
jgi:hypothetical protein